MTQQIFSLNIEDSQKSHQLNCLCGPLNGHLRYLEKLLNVSISQREGEFNITGEQAHKAKLIIQKLFDIADESLTEETIQLHALGNTTVGCFNQFFDHKQLRKKISAKTEHQKEYVQAMSEKELVFGIGPAGTGKTFLAMACAINDLLYNRVERIILTRPVVEAGEKLGFLPGDLTQKVDPYLRPLYDALYTLYGSDRVQKLFEEQVIEIAPLAYMRGRTLSNAFVILDEAQNTTCEQMKMFLTRIGYGSKVVITGDLTQIDLPRGVKSGLRQSTEVLKPCKDIAIINFKEGDVLRHPLVAKIVGLYEKHSKNEQ